MNDTESLNEAILAVTAQFAPTMTPQRYVEEQGATTLEDLNTLSSFCIGKFESHDTTASTKRWLFDTIEYIRTLKGKLKL